MHDINPGFFFQIKGMHQNINYKELDRMLSIFNLKDNFHTLSSSMSGGVRRKLSIIIAFSGGSKVLKSQRQGNDVSTEWEEKQGLCMRFCQLHGKFSSLKTCELL